MLARAAGAGAGFQRNASARRLGEHPEKLCLLTKESKGVAHHGSRLIQEVEVEDTIAHIKHVLLSADEVVTDAFRKLSLEVAGLLHHDLDTGAAIALQLETEAREAG